MPAADGADVPVVAVAGGKGGCGKTTTTLGLALAGARAGWTVDAVDADLDVPDLHRLAGADQPAGPEDSPAPRPVPGTPGARVIPAPTGADPADLRSRLPDGRSRDLVLVDCPAGAGRDVAVPLRVADYTLVVGTHGRASLRDAAKTAAMSRALDTPVVGAAIARTASVPGGVADLLDASPVVAVPAVERPLRDRTALRRYARLLRRLPPLRWP